MRFPKILDSAVGEVGPTQTISDRFLRLSELPLRMHVNLGSGDVVTIYGRLDSTLDWDILHQFTDETPIDVYPSKEMKAERTTNGAVGDSEVYVQNPYLELSFTEHAA